jgi:hypothetical protein
VTAVGFEEIRNRKKQGTNDFIGLNGGQLLPPFSFSKKYFTTQWVI